MITYRLRSRAARLALAMLMLLATQVALAHQLCRAVMLGSNGGHVMNVVAQASEQDVANVPCCGEMSHPGTDCRLVAIDAATTAAPPLAKLAVHVAALPPPIHVPALSIGVDRPGPVALPAARAGPPLPVYIRFARFLS